MLFVDTNSRTKKAQYCDNCKVIRKRIVAQAHAQRRRKNAKS